MVTVSLATLPERIESLKDTVDSLIGQVDVLNVFLDGHFEVPDFLKKDKINIQVCPDPEESIGDLGKFAFNVPEGYHLTCDDDLIYPEDYVKSMIEAIDEYNREVIISYCGNIPDEPPIASYYDERTSAHLFNDLEEDKIIAIPGTGAMGYYVNPDIPSFKIHKKRKNMADIHFGIYAKEQKIPVVVRKHKGDWIKHNDKVDLKKTIFAQHYGKDAHQADLINDNFSLPKILKGDKPKVSIVVINSRQLDHPKWVAECFKSLKGQTYDNSEIVVVRNYNKLVTIGKCMNEAVKRAKGDWILFVGDDDYLSPDYVECLVHAIESKEAIAYSTYLNMFDEKKNGERRFIPKQLVPTGIWSKEYLLKYPAKEYLTKQVDSDMMDAAARRGDKQFVLNWQFGYFYRSHSQQVSGRKVM